MKTALWIGVPILLVLGTTGIYLYMAVQDLKFEYKIQSYTPTEINLPMAKATISIGVALTIRSSFFFPIPVNFLYYEIHYKDTILGKSANTAGFEIKNSPEVTEIVQYVDLLINSQSLEVVRNYLTKTPTSFKIRVIVNVFGINIDLKEINFTY